MTASWVKVAVGGYGMLEPSLVRCSALRHFRLRGEGSAFGIISPLVSGELCREKPTDLKSVNSPIDVVSAMRVNAVTTQLVPRNEPSGLAVDTDIVLDPSHVVVLQLD